MPRLRGRNRLNPRCHRNGTGPAQGRDVVNRVNLLVPVLLLLVSACSEDTGVVESSDPGGCSVGEVARCGSVRRGAECDASAGDRPETCDAEDEVTRCAFDILGGGGGVSFSLTETSQDWSPVTTSYSIGANGRGSRYYNGRSEDDLGPSDTERMRSVDVRGCTTLDCLATAVDAAELEVVCRVDA